MGTLCSAKACGQMRTEEQTAPPGRPLVSCRIPVSIHEHFPSQQGPGCLLSTEGSTEALFRVSCVEGSHTWDFAIGGKHRLHMPQGLGTGICLCVRVCADGTEGTRWILALQWLPWAMASLGSWTSFSSFSSWTQEAAAIWARAEAQLAATPTKTTNDCSSLSLFSNHFPKAPLQKTCLPTGHAPSAPQGCPSGHVSWDVTPSGT